LKTPTNLIKPQKHNRDYSKGEYQKQTCLILNGRDSELSSESF